MADLSIDFAGIKSPNPFWLASAPPTNTGDQVRRAFDAGWGGAVWKTLGNPIVNVSSRFGGIDYGTMRLMGLNNVELITDRPLDLNLKEMREVKRRYPGHALIASLMVETKDEWREIIRKAEDTGADGLELNFGCPHGMCERGMGSAVGNEPAVLQEIARWAVEFATTPVIVKLTPNVGDILEPGEAVLRSGAHGISLINTIKSLMGVDLERMVPLPRVGGASTNGGYCGPAVKPIALHLLSQLARHPQIARLPISGIGGISSARDAAEFIALGATSVQVCTAVMHYGYRIVEEMIEGLGDWLDEHGMRSVSELRGRAIPQVQEWGELDLSYRVVAEISAEKCIGCQLCYVACMDGAHQCIHLPGRTEAEARAAGHTHIPKVVPDRPVTADPSGAAAPSRVPFVDEEECIGCNLCALVCPVSGCITMREVPSGRPPETWNDRVQKGTDFVPGGLEATARARSS
ncbi:MULTISPECIES: NAD-dependent dihydropyrimidine dehydrogenase subunit PreA [Sorangium]|uniref:dihydrouracil dehydrogenase (NAD(+)) n=1 Tax=Sorangium cellulosum TaxID=56 RepID=A0A4P2QZF5_SORCE|nr:MULTISPECIES: NAD-dependent dihydropyrimidine dehydrogenase subunit PreA [Sorangium]AUX35708.1 dihydropyrimidine dehydrogenase subunit B [Sorangium cellulosum]WCQ95008.1 NAD-dependent dihydropyrimidine dehydrogenase subunit PreA [Sorangium sp. Soce836]